jgi:hypothetical protein
VHARDVRAWRVEIRREDGVELRLSGRGRRRSVALPRLPLGYHRVRVTLTSHAGAERVAEQRLILVPPRCPTPRDRLAARAVYGVLANLYTVRSASNWGCGDLSTCGAWSSGRPTAVRRSSVSIRCTRSKIAAIRSARTAR